MMRKRTKVNLKMMMSQRYQNQNHCRKSVQKVMFCHQKTFDSLTYKRKTCNTHLDCLVAGSSGKTSKKQKVDSSKGRAQPPSKASRSECHTNACGLCNVPIFALFIPYTQGCACLNRHKQAIHYMYMYVYIVGRTLLLRLLWKQNGRPLNVLLVETFISG